MPTADPISTGYALLYSTLTGDSTFMGLVTGVYQDMAPSGATPDYALLGHQSGRDVNSATAVRQLSSLLFQVKIVGPASDAATLRAAYARADALLMPGGAALRNAGGTHTLYREQPFSLPELVNGVLWLNVGGFYRIEV